MFSRLLNLFRRRPREEIEDELEWMMPPADPLDGPAWDRYWDDQIQHGFAWMFNMFCDDGELIEAMRGEGMRRILCAGCGITQEPRALAEAGFDVVALELSHRALEIAEQRGLSAEVFDQMCGPGMQSAGGHVEYVVGDILDASVCPGPFDVILERRTAQLFHNRDMTGFMKALTARLDDNGIFFSHCHDARWRPPQDPRHFPAEWFSKNHWTIWNGSPAPKPAGRVAWLFTSTG